MKPSEEDRILSKDGAQVIIDETSLEYLKGNFIIFTNKICRYASFSGFRQVLG